MYGCCVRPRKTHLWWATCCSFRMNTLRVILTDDLCVRRTWKINPQKELEQDISIFLQTDDSEQCGTQNNVQHCRAPCTVTWTAVVGGKRPLRLRFCSSFVFPTENKFRHLAFCLFLVLCLWFLAFVTVSRPPRVCQIWLTRYLELPRRR